MRAHEGQMSAIARKITDKINEDPSITDKINEGTARAFREKLRGDLPPNEKLLLDLRPELFFRQTNPDVISSICAALGRGSDIDDVLNQHSRYAEEVERYICQLGLPCSSVLRAPAGDSVSLPRREIVDQLAQTPQRDAASQILDSISANERPHAQRFLDVITCPSGVWKAIDFCGSYHRFWRFTEYPRFRHDGEAVRLMMSPGVMPQVCHLGSVNHNDEVFLLALDGQRKYSMVMTVENAQLGWMLVQSLRPVPDKCKCKTHYIDAASKCKFLGIPKPILLAGPTADISIEELWVKAASDVPVTLPNDTQVEIVDTYGYEGTWDYVKVRIRSGTDQVDEGWVTFEHMPELTEPFRSLSHSKWLERCSRVSELCLMKRGDETVQLLSLESRNSTATTMAKLLRHGGEIEHVDIKNLQIDESCSCRCFHFRTDGIPTTLVKEIDSEWNEAKNCCTPYTTIEDGEEVKLQKVGEGSQHGFAQVEKDTGSGKSMQGWVPLDYLAFLERLR